MIELGFASAEELDAIKRLRRDVFAAELAIQSKSYQDVFRDAFSKNVVLRESAQVVGAVRLAFSRETQEYYVSYLVLDRNHRRRFSLALLVGAIFRLMEINGIENVSIDAHPRILPRYLAAGCQAVGSPRRKYGFLCAWTPLVYRVGTHPDLERRLALRAGRFLDSKEARWEFHPEIVACADLAEFETCLEFLIRSGRIDHVIPCVLGDSPVGRRMRFKVETLVPVPRLMSWASLQATAIPEHSRLPQQPSFREINEAYSNRNVVFVRRGAGLESIAACYGMLTGSRCIPIDDWFRLPSDVPAETAVLFIEFASCTHELYRALREQLGWCAWGVMAGESPEALCWLMLKNYLSFTRPAVGGDLLLLPLEDAADRGQVGDTTILDRSEFLAGGISERLRAPHRVLSLMSHGRGDIVYQWGHYLCGRSRPFEPATDPRPLSENVPCCELGLGCYRSGERTLATDVAARVVFANTCFAFSHIFAPEYTVGWSLLMSRASHVISVDRAKGGSSVENRLVLCLIKSGLRCGEVVRLLNEIVSSSSQENPCYVLFGDPAVRLAPPARSESRVRREEGEHEVVYDIESPPACSLASFDLHEPDGRNTHADALVEAAIAPSVEHAYVRNGESTRLLLFRVGGLPRRLRVTVHTRDPWLQAGEVIERFVRNTLANQAFHVWDPRSKGVYKSILEGATHLARLVAAGRRSPAANRRLLLKARAAGEHILESDTLQAKTLLERIVRESWIISDGYEDLCRVERELPSERCHMCGERTYVRLVQHSTLRSHRRIQYNCAHCGVVGDVPHGYVAPRLRSKNVFQIGVSSELIMSLHNPTESAMSGCAGVRLYQSADYDLEYRPGLQTFNVGPRETARLTFAVTPGPKVPRHLLFLKSIAVSAGAILYAQRNVWFREVMAGEAVDAHARGGESDVGSAEAPGASWP